LLCCHRALRDEIKVGIDEIKAKHAGFQPKLTIVQVRAPKLLVRCFSTLPMVVHAGTRPLTFSVFFNFSAGRFSRRDRMA
jgi:hypothetical protein